MKYIHKNTRKYYGESKGVTTYLVSTVIYKTEKITTSSTFLVYFSFRFLVLLLLYAHTIKTYVIRCIFLLTAAEKEYMYQNIILACEHSLLQLIKSTATLYSVVGIINDLIFFSVQFLRMCRQC